MAILDVVADTSAAALGFIHGDIKGAFKAVAVTRKLRNDMVKRKSGKHSANRKKAKTSTKRAPKRSIGKVATVNSVAGARSSVASSSIGTSLRLPRVVKRESQPRIKQRKRVNVSKSFRAKTLETLAEKKVTGIFVTDQVEFMRVGSVGNKQDWGQYPNNGHSKIDAQGQLFGSTRIMHAASRCWNLKASKQEPLIGDTQMFGSDGVTTLPQYKVDVRNQWWEFDLKNNTHKTLNIKIHQCGHKKNGNYDAPLVALNEGLVFDFNNKTTISSTVASGGADVQLTDTTTLVKPELVSTFKKIYSTKTIEVILEPGQEYSFTVQGPRMLYDLNKFFSPNVVADTVPVYNEKQKNDISLMWQVNVDMGSGINVGGTATTFGQLKIPFPEATSVENAIERSHVLIIRSQYHCKLLMPEQTGFNKTGGTGTTQLLGQRKAVRVMDDFKKTDDTLFVNTFRTDVNDNATRMEE